MKNTEKPKYNHSGQCPTDIPSEKLINPPNKENAMPHTEKEAGENTTAKDPKLGNRNTTR